MLYAHDTRTHTRMHVHAGWVVFTCGVAVPLCVFDMSASPSTEFPDADDLERDHERGVRWWEVSSGCEEVQANRGWVCNHRCESCFPRGCGEATALPSHDRCLWGGTPYTWDFVGSCPTIRARCGVLATHREGQDPTYEYECGVAPHKIKLAWGISPQTSSMERQSRCLPTAPWGTRSASERAYPEAGDPLTYFCLGYIDGLSRAILLHAYMSLLHELVTEFGLTDGRWVEDEELVKFLASAQLIEVSYTPYQDPAEAYLEMLRASTVIHSMF